MTNKSGPNISQPDTAQAEEEYTRLHISPLDPQLLKVIVPEAVLPKARGVSFHTIQTFPDKPFGFVELPTSAADKIKKKLNGAVLKGNKIRIEPARPAFDMPKPSEIAVADAATGADVEHTTKKSKISKKDRKRKRDPNEIVGVELEEGRKVKRGWTLSPDEAKLKKRKEKEKEKEKKEKKSSKDKKEKTKKKKREPESEYTEGPECLVKTSLPPNKRPIVESNDNGGVGADDDGTEKKKKSRKHKHQVVVHEFENTSKFPTFLKASTISTSDTPSDFVEGKGWVDDKGEVVQEVKSTRPLTFPKTYVEKKKKKKQAIVEDDTTSSSGSSDEEEDSDDDDDDKQSKVEADSEQPSTTAPENGPDLQTTSGSAGSDIASQSASPGPISASSAKSLSIRIPPATPSSTKVHPLEALYKKQKQEEAAANSNTADAEPFSFFGGGDIEEEEEEEVNGAELAMNEDDGENSPIDHSEGVQMPMTPFSKQDFESRGLRSAAPTPDTAHPSRFSRIWPLGGDRDRPSDVEEESDNDGLGSSKEDGSGDEPSGEGSTNPNTDFQKWFWEHRGDLNRSWKARRKMAAKEKRYRENRARADRAI